MRVTRLRPASLKKLWAIERTPNAEPWVAEVESFILDGGARSHQFEPASSILVVDMEGVVVGAAVHHQLRSFQVPSTSVLFCWIIATAEAGSVETYYAQ
jgi:hypothetical protein